MCVTNDPRLNTEKTLSSVSITAVNHGRLYASHVLFSI